MDEPALLALHNLSMEKLRLSMALGGLPMPSVAVIPAGMDFVRYGEVTLIARPELADPAHDPDVALFSCDVYSPCVPAPVWIPDEGRMEALETALRDAVAETGLEGPWDAPYQARPVRPDEMVRTLGSSRVAELAWLRGTGWDEPMPRRPVPFRGFLSAMPEVSAFLVASGTRSLDTPAVGRRVEGWLGNAAPHLVLNGRPTPLLLEWLEHDRRVLREGLTLPDWSRADGIVASAVEEKGRDAYRAWLEREAAAVFGDPRVLVAGEARPYTLENLVESMAVQERRGSAASVYRGAAQARSMAARPFRSLGDAMEQVGLVATREEFERERVALDGAFERILNTAMDLMPGVPFVEAYNRVGAALSDLMGQAEIRDETVVAAFARQGIPGLPQRTVDVAFDLVMDLATSRTEYFEAKVARAVDLGEFAAAVVPDDAPPGLVEELNGLGIAVVITYRAGDVADRTDVVRWTAETCEAAWKPDPVLQSCHL